METPFLIKFPYCSAFQCTSIVRRPRDVTSTVRSVHVSHSPRLDRLGVSITEHTLRIASSLSYSVCNSATRNFARPCCENVHQLANVLQDIHPFAARALPYDATSFCGEQLASTADRSFGGARR